MQNFGGQTRFIIRCIIVYVKMANVLIGRHYERGLEPKHFLNSSIKVRYSDSSIPIF